MATKGVVLSPHLVEDRNHESSYMRLGVEAAGLLLHAVWRPIPVGLVYRVGYHLDVFSVNRVAVF